MTTELEKQFFDTFGIEPKLNDCNWRCQKPSKLIYMCANNNDCEHCKEYPQITDKHYLELICVLNKHNYENYQCCTLLIGQTIEEVKKDVLTELIENLTIYELNTIKYNKFKHQVQAIFKGKDEFFTY